MRSSPWRARPSSTTGFSKRPTPSAKRGSKARTNGSIRFSLKARKRLRTSAPTRRRQSPCGCRTPAKHQTPATPPPHKALAKHQPPPRPATPPPHKVPAKHQPRRRCPEARRLADRPLTRVPCLRALRARRRRAVAVRVLRPMARRPQPPGAAAHRPPTRPRQRSVRRVRMRLIRPLLLVRVLAPPRRQVVRRPGRGSQRPRRRLRVSQRHLVVGPLPRRRPPLALLRCRVRRRR